MEARINMIGIITSRFSEMKDFYNKVLGFEIMLELEEYVEFKSEGVRFAISTNEVMHQTTGHKSFKENKQGQSLELAFQCQSEEEVNNNFEQLVSRGAVAIKKPENLPWMQRAAFFADPDGNIHEIFCDLN